MLDDGWSTKLNYSTYKFTLSVDGLFTYKSSVRSDYESKKVVNEVVIFGIKSKPTNIKKENGEKL